jgi:hypothetical protein
MLLTTVHAAHDLTVHALAALPTQQVPNPAPAAPPGSEKLNQILSYLKWLALAACAVGFLGGVIAFTAGRVVDNRRAGNSGALMMIAAVGGAILFGIGPAILNGFAGG